MRDLRAVLAGLGLGSADLAVLLALPDLRVVAGWDAAFSRSRGLSGRALERVQSALALAGGLVDRGLEGVRIKQVEDLGSLLGGFAAREQEAVVVVALDAAGLVLGVQEIACGGACAVSFDIAQALRVLVRFGAVGGAVIHNHPCGLPTPSKADREIAAQLRAAFAALDLVFWGFCVWGAGSCALVR